MENIKVKKLEQIFTAKFHENFRDLMDYAAESFASTDAHIIKTKGGKKPEYKHVTYDILKKDMNAFGTGLLGRGHKSQRIAVIGDNCYEWMLVYYTVPCGLGVTVPLDKGLPFEEVLSSVQRSRSDVLFFDKKHKDMIEKLKEEDTDIKNFYCLSELEGYDCIRNIIEEGYKILEGGDDKFWTLPINPDEMAVLLFTSGTSGLAKAVMLSQRNILSNVYAMEICQDIREGDVNISFLPYHHTFGCNTQILMYACGVTTCYCDGLKYVQKNMVEYHVTLFIGVPILIEAIYKKIMREAEKMGQLRKLKSGMKLSMFLRKFKIDVRRKLFKSVIDKLGGELRFVFSGASALDAEVIKGYEAMGIKVVQGYGQTESSPVITAESPIERRPGSIGKPLSIADVEIANPNEEGIGEIIARSPSVMLGYYEDPEETDKTIIDGWLHTGDLGRVDKDGFMYITGRVKNVIVLKNGKNIYPEEIESLITPLPYVKENIIIAVEKRDGDGGNGELALCSKIVYDTEVMDEMLRSKFKDYDEASKQKYIEELVWADLDKLNAKMPKYKQITRLIVQENEMIKTTTGKVKRFEEKKA